MITVLAFSDNPISQEEYNEIVDSLQIHHLACSCGRSACMHTHGYYVRYICLPDGKTPLRILRVKCSECITTHAILLSSIVPYSQISLQDQCSIISTYEQGTDCESQGLFSLAVKSAYRAHQPVNRLFGTILTDRGVEFGKPQDLETGIKGIERTSIYCESQGLFSLVR